MNIILITIHTSVLHRLEKCVGGKCCFFVMHKDHLKGLIQGFFLFVVYIMNLRWYTARRMTDIECNLNNSHRFFENDIAMPEN